MEGFIKVRVKEGKIGFIYGKLRKGDESVRKPEEFTLKAFKHPVKKDNKGEPLVVTAEDQFSETWMEKVEQAPTKKPDKEDKPEKTDKKKSKE